MSLRQTGSTKIVSLANKIKELITTHENKTGSSLQKGHVQAGGAPQTIGKSLSAGTDNGYYARADHVHTVDYSNILNVPSTFSPSAHNHDTTYYTKAEIDDLLEDIILDNIFLDENGDLVIGTTISGFLLNGTKNIIQSQETSTLTVTAYDAYSNVVEDEPIQLFKDNVLLGIYNTNSSGQVNYTYTGNGSGVHEFIAKNGRFQSEPYEVMDTILYDKGEESSHNDNCWVGLSNYSVSWETGGRTVTKSTSGNGYLYVSTSGTSPYKDFTQDFAIEFTYLGHSGTCILGISNGNAVNKYFGTSSSNLNLTSGDVLKVEVTTSNIKYYKNGEEMTGLRTNYSEGASFVTFILNNGSISFKDFKIYPI